MYFTLAFDVMNFIMLPLLFAYAMRDSVGFALFCFVFVLYFGGNAYHVRRHPMHTGINLLCSSSTMLVLGYKNSCEIQYFVETHLCTLFVILRSRVIRVNGFYLALCPVYKSSRKEEKHMKLQNSRSATHRMVHGLFNVRCLDQDFFGYTSAFFYVHRFLAKRMHSTRMYVGFFGVLDTNAV